MSSSPPPEKRSSTSARYAALKRQESVRSFGEKEDLAQVASGQEEGRRPGVGAEGGQGGGGGAGRLGGQGQGESQASTSTPSSLSASDRRHCPSCRCCSCSFHCVCPCSDDRRRRAATVAAINAARKQIFPKDRGEEEVSGQADKVSQRSEVIEQEEAEAEVDVVGGAVPEQEDKAREAAAVEGYFNDGQDQLFRDLDASTKERRQQQQQQE